MTLGSVAVGAAIVVFSVIFIVVAMPVLVFHPDPFGHRRALYARAAPCAQVYMANGCFYCHSQFIRPQDWNQPGVTDSAWRGSRRPATMRTIRRQCWATSQWAGSPEQRAASTRTTGSTRTSIIRAFVNPKSIMPEFSYLWDTNDQGNITPIEGFLKIPRRVCAESRGKWPTSAMPNRFRKKLLFRQCHCRAERILNIPGDRSGQFSDTNQRVLLSVVPQNFWKLLDPAPPDERSLIDGKTIRMRRTASVAMASTAMAKDRHRSSS